MEDKREKGREKAVRPLLTKPDPLRLREGGQDEGEKEGKRMEKGERGRGERVHVSG